jgi:hypothetical protein
MKNIYITVVSYEYVLMAISIVRALASQQKECAIYCIDDRAADLLEDLNLKSCMILRPEDYTNDKLSTIRKNRSDSEFCWTCKSVALEHILTQVDGLNWAIYLDSDMMIYGDPDQGLPPGTSNHVMLTPHRPSNSHFKSFMAKAGDYNAGYIAFRNSKEGQRALRWWRNKCEESCSVNADNGIYADQRYLNAIPHLFNGVFISEHIGVNAAPWNIIGKDITSVDGVIYINDLPLLIYHMQGLKKIGYGLFDLYCGEQKMSSAIRDIIYIPYLCHLKNAESLLSKDYHRLTKLKISLLFRLIIRELKRVLFGVSNIYWYRLSK